MAAGVPSSCTRRWNLQGDVQSAESRVVCNVCISDVEVGGDEEVEEDARSKMLYDHRTRGVLQLSSVARSVAMRRRLGQHHKENQVSMPVIREQEH